MFVWVGDSFGVNVTVVHTSVNTTAQILADIVNFSGDVGTTLGAVSTDIGHLGFVGKLGDIIGNVIILAADVSDTSVTVVSTGFQIVQLFDVGVAGELWTASTADAFFSTGKSC